MATNPQSEGDRGVTESNLPSGASSEDVAAEAIFGLLDDSGNVVEKPAVAEETEEESEETEEESEESEEEEEEDEEASGDTDEDDEEVSEDNGEEEDTDKDSEEEDSTEDEDVYVIRVDGKDVEVTEDELLNGYLRQSDYTRKTQAIAEERKEFQTDKDAIALERGEYLQALEFFKSNMMGELSKFEGINWEELKTSDPDEWQTKRLEYQQATEKLQATQAEQERVFAKQKVDSEAKFKQEAKTESAKLLEMHEELANEDTRKELRDYALEQGVTAQELEKLVDSRSLSILFKAMQFDAQSKKTSKIAKKKIRKKTPKFVKSGSPASKRDVSKAKTRKMRQKAKASGDVHDAAAVIFEGLD